jgi:catalase
MTFKEAESFHLNPFDLTKVWPHKDYPLIPVGRLVLDRNPANYFAEVEQAAFSPAHMVPGIEPSPDKMLQGRLFSYVDTHLHRLGTNYNQIPINCPYNARVRNYQRDGPQCFSCKEQETAPNYYPNSFSGPVDDEVYLEECKSCPLSADVGRYKTANDENFVQVGDFYRKVLSAAERDELAQNIAGHLISAQEFIQKRAVDNFAQADPEYGAKIRKNLDELAKKAKAAPAVSSSNL